MRLQLVDWLRVEHGIEKASMKLQALTGLDSDAFIAEVKRIRGKKNPLSAAITLGGARFRDKWGTPDVIGKRESMQSDII